MIIKGLLIGLILLISGWFLLNRTKAHARAGVKIIAILFTLAAVVTILFPETSNAIANKLGVGRGADLILYMLTASFLFFILSYYVRSSDEQKKIVKLARKIAILEASINQKNNKKQ